MHARRSIPAQHTRAAFTLIEVMATLAVVGALAMVSSRLVLDSADAYADAVARARLCSDMSAALERLTIELRSAPLSSESSPSGADLTALDASAISWNDGSSSRVVALVGTELVSTTGGSAAPLLEGVTGFTVRALDDNHAPLSLPRSGSSCREARRIEITITCERGGVEETLRTLVFMRAAMAGSL